MPAYIVAEIDVTDPAGYESYKKMAGDSPKRIVVIEFPSVEAAEKFYHSPDYQAAVKVRQKASKGRLYIVEA
jgi:uncharacterized protein (DUF1330 family)